MSLSKISFLCLFFCWLGCLSVGKEQLTHKNIHGLWVYYQVTYDQVSYDPITLDECGIRDTLSLEENSLIERYEFEGATFKGNLIGVSDARTCALDPISFQYRQVDNSCKTNWLYLLGQTNRLLSMSEAGIVEYEVQLTDSNTMLLTKIKEISNTTMPQAELIELKRVQ